MLTYPAPRYPKFRRPKSVEELMPKARDLVNQPLGRPPKSMKPSYNIQPGNKILFVTLSEYDPMVVEAMCRAMREKEARVDMLTFDSEPVGPAEEIGAHEAIAFGKEDGDFSYYYTMICNLLRTETARELVKWEKYDMIISGMAGSIPPVKVPWYYFCFPNLEDFASPLLDYPMDLLELLDKKVLAQVDSCETLRLTDPEGTDIGWTNYNDERYYTPSHIRARPSNPGYGFGGKDDCEGVIAGTLNHMGAFPHCKAFVKGGQVVRVEGGGLYGNVWREKLEQYKTVKMPPLATLYGEEAKYEICEPGLFWFMECAIGTHPKQFRPPKAGRLEHYANSVHDRKRSGYIHNGIGPPTRGRLQMQGKNLPWVHVHIHCLFPTLEGRTKAGEKVTVIDKGHLTMLDDPEVRSLAGRDDNPDEFLKESWIPALPGINVPGDYLKDYGNNPVPWLKREADENPIWIEE